MQRSPRCSIPADQVHPLDVAGPLTLQGEWPMGKGKGKQDMGAACDLTGTYMHPGTVGTQKSSKLSGAGLLF